MSHEVFCYIFGKSSTPISHILYDLSLRTQGGFEKCLNIGKAFETFTSTGSQHEDSYGTLVLKI